MIKTIIDVGDELGIQFDSACDEITLAYDKNEVRLSRVEEDGAVTTLWREMNDPPVRLNPEAHDLRKELIVLIKGHIEASEMEDDAEALLDIFDCEECQAVKAELLAAL